MLNHKNIVVLMYHGVISSVEDIPPQRDIGANIYDVTTENFRSQMEWLKKNDYRPSLIGDFNLTEKNQRNIILTFDDGEMNNFIKALPILKNLAFPAYFFIIVKRVGKPGYMGWEQIKELHHQGMAIGSHGLSHEILTDLKDTQIEEELTASKRTLENNLGFPIEALSIPRGFCNKKIIDMAHYAGYKYIFVSYQYTYLNENCFNRIAVKSRWDIKRFDMAIKGYIPVQERVSSFVILTAKTILRDKGYNWVRQFLLQ